MDTLRDQIVGIRFKADELERIKTQIGRSGLTRAAFVRMATLEKLEREEGPKGGQSGSGRR